MGFVDTNIPTLLYSSEENIRKLVEIHSSSEQWTEKHGVKFVPEKYQLMHFSRARTRHNMKLTVRIQGHLGRSQTSLRILGIYLDPKLNWNNHIKITQTKAESQLIALSRLTQSTWGASFHKSLQVYNAIVGTAFTYGSPIWAEAGPNSKILERMIKPLKSIQRKCLKLVTGAYKLTSCRVLEHETSTLPIDIYLKHRRLQYIGISRQLPVHGTILLVCRKSKLLWIRIQDISDGTKAKGFSAWETICGKNDTRYRQKAAGKVTAFEEWKNPGIIEPLSSLLTIKLRQIPKSGWQPTCS